MRAHNINYTCACYIILATPMHVVITGSLRKKLREPEHKKKMAFSPRTGPPELAKWLLDLYGEAYRDDINKLESESAI